MSGIALQKDSLFTGSIADNISFFNPEATATRIEAALSNDETMQVSAGSGSVWYNVSYTIGGWYAGAVDKTADFFEWVDGLDGSVSD